MTRARAGAPTWRSRSRPTSRSRGTRGSSPTPRSAATSARPQTSPEEEESSLRRTACDVTLAGWTPDERVALPDRHEAEPLVEPLRTVVVVGHDPVGAV